MFHKSLFLMMIVAATFMILRNPQYSNNRNILIIVLTLIAIVITQNTTKNIEKFEENNEPAVAEKSEKTTNESKSEEKIKASESIVKRTSPDQNIGLDKFNTEFKDKFPEKFAGNQLVYYTSTFDRANVDNKAMYNMMKIEGDSENKMEIPADVQYIIDQRDGIYINFKHSLSTVYPRDIKFNTQEFSLMWYGKFVPTKYDTDVFKQHVYLINIPVHDATNIIGIEFEFRSEYVNPTIRLHWKGNPIEGGEYRFESISNDSDKSKNFFDNQYHLFTLIKNKDNEIKLILDDQTHTASPLISTIIKNDENPIINEKNSYKITFNSNVDNPTSVDDNIAAKAPNTALNLYLCAFAIFNKAIDYADISRAFEYFKEVRYNLDPRTLNLKKEIDTIKNDSSCPFSDKSLCNTPNCLTTDWKDQGNILSNEKCFNDVAKYCASIESHANDKICTFYDLDNSKKKVTLLEPEQKLEQETLSEEEDIVKQLRKIGLNNIHLDKSLRANGKYSDEINQLIDKIYEQKQLNLKGISSLEDVDDINHSPLKYGDLIEKDTTKDPTPDRVESAPQDGKEKVSESIPTKPKSDLINLEYRDLDDYDNLLKEYDTNKKNEVQNEQQKPSIMTRIFG